MTVPPETTGYRVFDCPECKGVGAYFSRVEAQKHKPHWRAAHCPVCLGRKWVRQRESVAKASE